MNMPNGDRFGTDEEWRRAEAPLKRLDIALAAFAAKEKIVLTKNGRDWPERSMQWSRNNARCLIQIFAERLEIPTFNFWICTSQDRKDTRYWKQNMLKRDVLGEEIEGELPELLKLGKLNLDSWSDHPEEFEAAAKLGAVK